MVVSRRIGRVDARRWTLTAALSVLALAAGAGPAGAHGGSTDVVHSCIVPSSYAIVVGPNEACAKNAQALDWPLADTNTTYTAGSGLSLSGTEFSVTGAPWSGLTGVPAGFQDGVDDVGSTAWNDLTGVPTDLKDGDNDGTAVLTQFSSALATDDGTPNQPSDLVSFSKLKGLESSAGGNILGSFIQDGTIENADVRDGTLRAPDLAGTYDFNGTESVVGAVTSEKIKDGTIEGRDLGTVVTLVTQTVDPQPIQAGVRDVVNIQVPGARRHGLVTVSPPALLEQGLIFAGSDVALDGHVSVYLHNATSQPIDSVPRTWTIRWIG